MKPTDRTQRLKQNLSSTLSGKGFSVLSSVSLTPTPTPTPTPTDTPTPSHNGEVTLLLNANGPDNSNNNVFLDSSSNNFTITRVGNATQGSFSPFPPNGAAYNPAINGGSGYFDGSSVLRVAHDPSLVFGSNDFTIEMWCYYNTVPGYTTLYSKRPSTLITNGFSGVGIGAFYGNFGFVVGFDGSTWGIRNLSVVPVDMGMWQHIALVRNGNNFTFYKNGNAVYTATNSQSINDKGSPVTVGADGDVTDFYTIGYISNLRVVNGTALYTSNFTPSTSPLTNIPNTSLLLNFTNGGVIDSTTKNDIITVGNSIVSNSVKKYGTGSVYFDGDQDYLLIPATPALTFGSDDFTIEAWVYRNSTTLYHAFITNADGPADNNYYAVSVDTDGTANFQIRDSEGTQFYVYSPQNAVPFNQWTHIAAVRHSGVMKLFVNGTKAETSLANSTNISQRNTLIGGFLYPGHTNYYSGYIDDLRVIKGAALYEDNFTPPTRELTL